VAKKIAEFQSEGGGWRIKVTTAGGTEFYSRDERQPNRGYGTPEGRYLIRFRIPFDISPDNDLGEIRLYNLDKASVKQFKRGELLKLEAGYHPFEKHKELVLNGTIEDLVVEELSKTTRMLTVYVGDTTDIWPVATATKGYAPGIKPSVIAADLANTIGLDIGKIDPKVDPPYAKRGLALVGATRPMFELLARDMQSVVYVARRKLYVLPPDQGVCSGVVLSGDNGLLSAKPAMEVSADMRYVHSIESGEKPQVHQVQALLTPKLWSNRTFEIDADDLPGTWRTIAGDHSADGRSFLTTVRVAKG